MRLLVAAFFTLSWTVDLFGCTSSGSDAESSASRLRRSPNDEANNKDNNLNPKWNTTWVDRLRKDLLQNYDKFARPAEMDTKIEVTITFILKHFEMDEQKSIMTLHAWVHMTWNDEKIKWNASEYGGLEELHFSEHELWQPDIFPFNGNAQGMTDRSPGTNFIAYANGAILWVPSRVYQIFCDFDMTHWPFDTQRCTLILGSWTYHGNFIELQTVRNATMEKIYNAEWKVLKIESERNSKIYKCCPDPYIDVTYNITVQRQSPTYVALLITPVTVRLLKAKLGRCCVRNTLMLVAGVAHTLICHRPSLVIDVIHVLMPLPGPMFPTIVVMTLCIFFIPPTSTDKITLGGTTMIITCLFLLYFTQRLPILAGRTPLIVLFYSKTLYLIASALVISVIVINIAKNPRLTPLPWNIKSILSGCLGKCLLINSLTFRGSVKSGPSASFKSDDAGDSLPVLSSEHERQFNNYDVNQQDWIQFAVAIDRIAFLLYSFIFIILAITHSV